MFGKLMKLKPTIISNNNLLYKEICLHLKARHIANKWDPEIAHERYLSRKNDVLAKYDKKKEEKILEVINNGNLNHILRYRISKGNAEELLKFRDKNGSLRNLKAVMWTRGFGYRIADKFFESIFESPKSDEMESDEADSGTESLVGPIICEEQKRSIKSIVSVRVTVNGISWGRLDVSGLNNNELCTLTHWQHHEFSGENLHIYELIQQCLNIKCLIPRADCYLFENPEIVRYRKKSLQKAQLTAIMGFALGIRNCEFNNVTNEPHNKAKYSTNIFYVNRLCPETTNPEENILNMMRMQSLKKNTNISENIQFPEELRRMFYGADTYRDSLSRCLLFNLAFVRFVLLPDFECIVGVSHNNKNVREV